MSNAIDSTGAQPSDLEKSTHLFDAQSQEDWNYEMTVTQIEAIIARIEAGDLELAEVFDQFAAAVEYLNQCELFLAQRKQQMDILIETLLDDSESY